MPTSHNKQFLFKTKDLASQVGFGLVNSPRNEGVMQRNRVEVQFRKLNDSDLELMFHWLNLPRVKEWCNDGDDTIEKVVAHYFDSNENVERFILESEEGKADGYFQCYSLDEIGID